MSKSDRNFKYGTDDKENIDEIEMGEVDKKEGEVN
jgi:hypothetical protein